MSADVEKTQFRRPEGGQLDLHRVSSSSGEVASCTVPMDLEQRKAALIRMGELQLELQQVQSELGFIPTTTRADLSLNGEQAQHYQLIAELASDCISVHSADGTYEFASPSFKDLLGYEPSDLVGQSAYLLFHPEDLARIAASHAQQGEGVIQSVRYRLRRSDGDYRWVTTNTRSRITPAGAEQIVCVTHDIHEEELARQRLAQTLEDQRDLIAFNEQLLSASSYGVVVFDASGICLLANTAACRLLAVEHNTLLDTNFTRIRSWRALGLDVMATDVLRDGQQRQFDGRFEISDKHKPWLEVTLARFQSKGTYHLLVMFVDVTPARELLEKLNSTNAELKRSNHDLEHFAFAASHDLRAPLRAIDVLAEGLEEELDEVLVEEQRAAFSLLRRRSQRMSRLIEDMLAYARATQQQSAPERVDVGELLQRAVELSSIPEGFTITTKGDSGCVRARTTPLLQILNNLISNALKHHDRDHGEIRVQIDLDQTTIRLTVSDDGPGIPEEHRERVFQMFQTLRPRDQVEGSGMGLAMVKRLVELHHADIALENREPRGCTFTVTWPIESDLDESSTLAA